MPEDKAGSIQQSIGNAISSVTNPGQTTGTPVNPKTVANAPGNVSGGNVNITLPPGLANGGAKK